MTTQVQPQIINNFEIPNWAGKPPPGLHLDVIKENKMVQKLMIDEKKVYFFGRNKQQCDFCIDHASCSRVHAVLVWHKHLNRPFIIDLASTHGTFIGSIRLEGKKPQAIPMDSQLHFGASTRKYVIREKPNLVVQVSNNRGDQVGEDNEGGNLMGLPETESELDNLTEFNTATNRRLITINDVSDPLHGKRKRQKNIHVSFNDLDDVINPEDIDPSVGRFRNLVHTVVVPRKKVKIDMKSKSSLTPCVLPSPAAVAVYEDFDNSILGGQSLGQIGKSLNIRRPNLAPDVDEILQINNTQTNKLVNTISKNNNMMMQQQINNETTMEPKKKKYAKEAWPGKKPTGPLAVQGNALMF